MTMVGSMMFFMRSEQIDLIYSIGLSWRRYKIMKKLIIMLDFISDPLRKDVFDTKNKELVTGIDLVDNDEYVQKINYNNQTVFFDK